MAPILEHLKVQCLSENILFPDNNIDTKTKFKICFSQSQGCIFYFFLLIFYFLYSGVEKLSFL